MTQIAGLDGRLKDDNLPQNSGMSILRAASNAGAATSSVYLSLTAAQTLFTFTTDNLNSTGAVRRQRYRVSATVNVLTLGTGSAQVQISYTDETGTARTRILTLIPESGVDGVTANATGPWSGSVDIITNPNTTVTVATIGTFTGGFTYDAQATCEQLLRQ